MYVIPFKRTPVRWLRVSRSVIQPLRYRQMSSEAGIGRSYLGHTLFVYLRRFGEKYTIKPFEPTMCILSHSQEVLGTEPHKVSENLINHFSIAADTV